MSLTTAHPICGYLLSSFLVSALESWKRPTIQCSAALAHPCSKGFAIFRLRGSRQQKPPKYEDPKSALSSKHETTHSLQATAYYRPTGLRSIKVPISNSSAETSTPLNPRSSRIHSPPQPKHPATQWWAPGQTEIENIVLDCASSQTVVIMAPPRYYSEDELAERQPLDSSFSPSPPRQQQQYQQQPYSSPPRGRPGAHPNSSFERLRAQRRYDQEPPNRRRDAGPYAAAGAIPNSYRQQADVVSPVSPQQQSPHRDPDQRYWGHGSPYPPSQQRPSPQSTITPGADNFSNVAAGGMAGIAMSVAEHNARESGLNAVNPHYPQDPERGMLSPADHLAGDRISHSSLQGLSAAAPSVGYATPGQRTPSRIGEVYMDDPYQNLSRHADSNLGVVNPNLIEDDGDDGLQYGRKGPRTSMLSLGSSRGGAGAAAGGAAAGGVLGGLVGRNGSGSVSNQYAPVHNGVSGDGASGGSGGGGSYGAGSGGFGAEKATKRNGKAWKLWLIFGLAVLVIAGVVCGVLFGVVFKKKGGSSGGGGSGDTSTAESDTKTNGDLSSDSSEIQALMNNPDLRKVFMGMDYTPLNTQYPDCVKNPASQNNVTRDLAVLSQLTNTIRLYGTDCNQTQMLIHAVNQLQLKDTVKIWLGVWQDKNPDTNKRQLDQMWDILKRYGTDYFKGIIVANEILFREQMDINTLGNLLDTVRSELKKRGFAALPVATSDLGDKWTSGLAAQSDAIMANIHPFFAGTPVKDAADWTRYFWGNKTMGFTKKDPAMNIIAETGWPSQGGMGCGNEWQTDCPEKSVAGIDEMNIFMEDWVCRALEDGTEYFWFEAFDEPWKMQFNTDGKEWEDHWGLFDVNRNLKGGLKIPDCGGKRIS